MVRSLNKHIILIGFMGTGKTTVGIELAKSLSLNYYDTDKEIEKKEGKKIHDIFSNEGEEFFRKLETSILTKITNDENPAVISTGGGIILSEINREILKKHITILLKATPEEIYMRVKDNYDRPLLNNKGDLLNQITFILNQRENLYLQSCNIIIDTNNKSINELIEEIKKNIN